MFVSAILKQKDGHVIACSPTVSVRQAAKTLQEHRIGALVVVDAKGLTGIFTERDIVRGIAVHGDAVLDMPIRGLMTPDVITCRPDDTVQNVEALMTERRFRHVPVLDGDMLVGIISIGDVVKNRLAECSVEVDSLRHYVSSSR
ncbi:MAG: CBS domain-containing protein [Alphaproteobacteria bacterium]